ncbi:helix-turn-helix transcriptional regulator [Acetivibrio straminisolvens]|uniref:helix-turn-helix transcriptional regulator n=1 Tax=Acetivibrio straminisolvens TaxID=253314 RepID=UPI0022406471|nr:helix-turn-helix transcriptional regulator [Acetivibrio straminisolvens]
MKNMELIRIELEMTQADTAAALGISEYYYRGIESGYFNPSKKIRDKLQSYFGLSAEMLLSNRNHILEILKGGLQYGN